MHWNSSPRLFRGCGRRQGAGDTFGGALTWCLTQGHAFAEALDFSIAAASRSVTIHGPRGGKTDVETVFAWRKDRRRR